MDRLDARVGEWLDNERVEVTGWKSRRVVNSWAVAWAWALKLRLAGNDPECNDLWFKVRWAGWSAWFDTYERRSTLVDSGNADVIDEYVSRYEDLQDFVATVTAFSE